jgi:hypothetical protein
MLKEIEYSFDGHTYLIKQLPLSKSQEVLLRLLGLLGGADATENVLASLPSRLKATDIDFFRDKLFGEHCHLQNDSGNWVPMGKAIVENHFAGCIGAMFHLLGKCLLVNYSSFLADLRLEDLVGEATSRAE